MKHSPKQIPAVGVKPKPVLSPSEQKNLATTLAATAIINDETAKWENKTARLKALRLAKEAAEQTDVSTRAPATKSKTVRKAKAR
ncbi:hypothetical protein SAMN05428967_2964 [Phyllobacterium sp. YR620]|uniref:hypothetical protein n=1 Tax=Phyllobacterium TaxID=28100 RepID=UPI00087F08C0|nr:MULTISPECIES: hypothetical protein [unclassified Phyllobacterium]UGY10857.1 hypothetical protein LLE51_006750 [Phyllobacterium sp. T1018]SDP68115.1 hypothetical protein SAMN05428967_2964 [Phyllobacterium sp. YR620]SFI57067.1 hypothetical protein SAMN04515648_0555 [Phyllobacterium sp. CL33Tsu]